MKKFLKILLLRHVWSDFEMISQKGSMDDPFQKLLAKFLSFKKHGSGEWGLLTKLLSVYSHGSGCEDLFALQGDKKNFLFLLH